ncbi:MAG: HAD-IC family P-type ATPase [Ketobacter sp.]|nr:HAD-IC family P-type ATPase [Ketobacter sp.]
MPWLENGLKTDFKNGIDEASIPEREHHFGSNRKEKLRVKTFWELVWETLDDLILKILVVAGIASIIINLIMEEEKALAWIEGFAILVAVVIVVLVTVFNDMKKEREFQKLNEEAEKGKKISIIRNGEEREGLNIQDVQAGDVIKLKSGMEIAGDGVVIEGFSLAIDESSMTGETKKMNKNTLEYCRKKVKQMRAKKGVEKLGHHDVPSPVLLAGTKVLTGTGSMVVITVGPNSSIGKIKEIMSSGEDELTPLQMKLEKIARDIGWFGLISAVIIFVVLLLRLIIESSIDGWGEEDAIHYVREILEYFIIAITILVVAIPEGLPLAVTLSLAFSVNKMMDDKNLVRRLQACETMGGANIICSDKTGTLTRNEMYLTHYWNTKEREIFNAEKNEALNFNTFMEKESQEIFKNTIILNSLDDPTKKEGNPTEMAILKYMHASGVDVVNYRNQFKVDFQANFSSDRKRMSTIMQVNGEHYAFMKGASEYVMEISDQYRDLETGEIVNIDYKLKNDMENAITHMAEKALRTIGMAYKKVDFESIDVENANEHGVFAYEEGGWILVGFCGIKDIIRAEVPNSIRKCHGAGIQVKMVTGDNRITAKAIAKEIGIITPENEKTAIVMEGPEFLRLVGGVVCKNCLDKEKCECVANERELKKPENKGKQIRKDTIKN